MQLNALSRLNNLIHIQNMEHLVYNNYYIITLSLPSIPQPNSMFDHNIVVRYKGYYKNGAAEKISAIFHHRVSNNYFEALTLYTNVCQNYILNNNDICSWESHIYADRFKVSKDITPTIKRICSVFKQLLNKRKTLIILTTRHLRFPVDIQQYIFKKYFGI